MTLQQRNDLKRVAQLGMVLVGAAILTGSLVGAVYGAARDVVAALADSDFDT